ncbi:MULTISPECIES: hypothetical protein [unclassified Crossiella]|uniref:hypothetical protein n=1 Tax=unclassified Crossiella TaxID=2620835 RepID=UPI001FFEC248|nr:MULTISPECIES: hypothetical protein [unclassified Crossiella]MCK2240928.1 hypothetical protein [Crossiella sp. S99.2]MCK2253928.1 hypothetical protein [Crossiella sp. S99.1]
MTALTCYRCGKVWDSNYLRTRGIRHVSPENVHIIQSLNDIAKALLITEPVMHTNDSVYPWATHNAPITVAFNFWWQNEAGTGAELRAAAERLVSSAMHSGLCGGLGCPKCGFQ